ncbi:alpha-ketoglutarate-dependent dioxygenase AlkB [Chloroflexia bacterium SDU3-3]|nr:alpha-ketoglutarate-dependent dioxygenase AlkB [Chloroflexia bacterium SDU3-3]
MIEIPCAVPGLRYAAEYLSAPEQQALLDVVDAQTWLADLRRRVQHYGYRYDYTRRTVDRSLALGPLPPWAAELAARLHREGWVEALPDQVIVNEYMPGQGIASHIDCTPCFGDTIVSLSLGSACAMVFSHARREEAHELLLAPGGLVVMRGESRYDWRHGIPARKSDALGGQRIARGRRVSLTFRTVILAD